ncbi:MAG: hypothetical protein HYX21_00925 [Candidatus Yanofskybacteria bacterium]|nr:hypothetical protein [Candidatus Yanofskybacteria bacterium]
MPCDIGYKNITTIRVEPKIVNEFKERSKAPKITKDLLENMGVTDVVFLEWASDLDINPLLNTALERALEAVDKIGKVEFLIRNGELEIKSKYTEAVEKRKIEAIAKKVSERFQIEVTGVIAQLLDYTIVVSEKTIDGQKTIILEGEKNEDANVHRYLKVSVGTTGEGVLAFEHFDSASSLKEERSKFLTLAKKFGVKIALSEEHESGQPIPQNVEHQHFLHVRS